MTRSLENALPPHPLLEKRWSPRAFDGRPVETEKPRVMLEAARWGASANNEQPWRFILAFHDVGQAAAARMTVQATALGLHVHQMAGFDAAKAREALSIPESYEPVAAIAAGHLGDPDSLP